MMVAQQRLKARFSESDCGGCSESAPCESCGTPRNDPTHRRAEWAAFVAGENPSQSEFFRTAMMADVFFSPDAGGRSPASDSLVTHLVQLRQAAVISLPSPAALPESTVDNTSLSGFGIGRLMNPGGTIWDPPLPLRLVDWSKLVAALEDSPVVAGEPPPESRADPQGHCCCVARDISVTPVPDSSGNPQESVAVGGSFFSVIGVQFFLGKDTEKGIDTPCSFLWEEKPSSGYTIGSVDAAKNPIKDPKTGKQIGKTTVPGGKWSDLTNHPAMTTVNAKQTLKELEQPCGKSPTTPIRDEPGGGTGSRLVIKITLKSGTGCGDDIILYVVQTVDGGGAHLSYEFAGGEFDKLQEEYAKGEHVVPTPAPR